MKSPPLTLAFGDIRWDVSSTGRTLAGAAAVFSARFAALGYSVRCAGSVGADSMGDEALQEVISLGVDPSLIQRSAILPTERADVEMRSEGIFDIREHLRGASSQFAESTALTMLADEIDVLFWSSTSQRDDITGSTLRTFLEGSPPSFKIYDVDCSLGAPTREELEGGLSVASVIHLRGREIPKVCEVLGLPELEPGLLAPAVTERYGVSYCIISDPLAGALVSSVVGEQVGLDIAREHGGDLRGWYEALLAGFVHHVIVGSSLARCCGAGVQYAEAVATGCGALSLVEQDVIRCVKEPG